MSDTKASEANEPETDRLLSPDMKSNINNCDETSANEKEFVSPQDDGSVKDEASSDLPTNGHQKTVNGDEPNESEGGGDEEAEENKDESGMKPDDEVITANDKSDDSSCADESKDDAEESVSRQINPNEDSNPVTDDDSICDNDKSQQSSMEIESVSNTVVTTDDRELEVNSTSMSAANELMADLITGESIDEGEQLENTLSQQSDEAESSSINKTDETKSTKPESKDVEGKNAGSKNDSLPESVDEKEEEKENTEQHKSKTESVLSLLKVDDDEDETSKDEEKSKIDVDPEDDDESKEIKINVDDQQQVDDHSDTGSTSDTKASSPKSKSSSNVITEVVVGDNDEVTLDLSKTLTNGVKEPFEDEEDDEEDDHQVFTKTESNKRDFSSISSDSCAVEDLSLPSKRRAIENGDGQSEVNGTIANEEEEECEQFDELLMPPTPPQDELDEKERIRKLKLYRRLKQELLNEDAKLVLLKKMRQSQLLLKENISQNQSASSTAPEKPAVAASVVASTPSSTTATGSVGVNLSNNLRELNLLASHYHQSLSQSGSHSGALNFSTSHNSSKQASSLVNNNVAHSNSQSSLYLKNNSNLAGLNMAHQAPMQAHLPKASSHGKGNSVLNPPFGSLGRSPYNHLNSHLSAPPPSAHGSNSSSKQRSSYDSPNLNTAHSSNRTSGSLNSASLNRSSMATPPNLAYSDMRPSSASSKFAQHISQSASPSPTIHNQINESPRPDPLLAQRQAANVKQVLRKQLEKMPQPKVPPPEMHFIPNPSNAEFIYYIGLEKVVDYLTGNNQVFQPPDPFECVQCGTDFTPVWKWKDRSDPSKPSVICEKCVSNNMKKVVMDEHTKRIHTFSKAYEELEKQMASAAASAGTITPPTAAISPSLTSNERVSHSTREHTSATSNLASASHNASHNTSANNSNSHNLYGSNNSAVTSAALAAAAANFGSLGAGLSGLQHQQAHSNSLTAQQVAAMAASFLPQSSNTSAAHQMSTPPAAHSSSRTSNSFANNLAAAFSSSNANAQAQSAAATLALLQQLPKMNSQATAQSLYLAQQLQAFSALVGGGNNASNAGNAAMAQLLGGFPSLFYQNILAASIANQKSVNQQQQQQQSSSSTSSLNAAAAAFQRQLLMDILPGASGNSRSSGHHSSSSNSSSMPHHNWKS